MTYEYLCEACGNRFDVIKRAADYDNPETCKCNAIAKRVFNPRIYLSNTSVQEKEFNPGLGCVTNNRQHRAEICKQRGLIEVGNENPDKLGKHFQEAREKKREESWDKANAGWVGDGT